MVEMDSFTWEAYTEAGKYLDLVPTIPWEERGESFSRFFPLALIFYVFCAVSGETENVSDRLELNP